MEAIVIPLAFGLATFFVGLVAANMLDLNRNIFVVISIEWVRRGPG